MKLGPIANRLKIYGIDGFEGRIAGAVELSTVQEDTLLDNTIYVVQYDEIASPNDFQGDVSQNVTESFAVIVVVKNDTSQADKTGITAYDSLFNIRKRLFNILVGWDIDDEDEDDGFYSQGPIYYKRGELLDVNSAWLWYQYIFEYQGKLVRTLEDPAYDSLDTISTQYILTPDAQIPIKKAGNLADLNLDTDLDQIIDLTESLTAGAFVSGFASGFDLYEG